MTWTRECNFKFIFRVFPCGSLIIWGIPGNFDLHSELNPQNLERWITERKLLRFAYDSVESGLNEFFTHLRKGILHWFEDPWVFFTIDPELQGREIDGHKIFYVPENSAPKEFRFVEKIEALKDSAKLPDSPRLQKQKLLLHVCCGPDAAGVVKQLKEDFELSCFWYDPNIQPKLEHDLRLEAFKKVMEIYEIPFIEGPYDVENFEAKISSVKWSPEQGAKCSLCYDMRLEKSAALAKELAFDAYATTLAISPHKVQEKLIQFGELSFKKLGVRYYHKNFMKEDGFKDSVDFTREHQIYRQDYCGCYYSLFEGGPEAKQKAKDWGFLPPGPRNS